MNWAKTSEIAEIPKVSTAIVMAMKKTSQNISLPKMESGVWLVCDLSKNCFMPPLFIQPWKPMLWSTLVTMPCRTLAMMKPTTRMMMAPMSAGSAPRMAPSPSDSDCVIACMPFSFSLIHFAFWLRPGASRLRAPKAAQGASDQRDQQRGDAGGRQDGAQTLRDLVLDVARHLGQRDPGELVDKARAHDGTDDREHQYDEKREHRHQDAVLEARPAGEAPRHVAPDQEGQKQRHEQPHEARDAALGTALHAQSAQDTADHRADDAAKDKPGPEGRKPAEDDAGPARPEFVLPAPAVFFAIPAHFADPARSGLGMAVAASNLVFLDPRRVGVAPASFGHLSPPSLDTFCSSAAGPPSTVRCRGPARWRPRHRPPR